MDQVQKMYYFKAVSKSGLKQVLKYLRDLQIMQNFWINYHILISRFVLVPMIFARKNTDVKRIITTLTPQISIWNGKKYLLNIWKKIVKELAEILEIWPVLRELAGM